MVIKNIFVVRDFYTDHEFEAHLNVTSILVSSLIKMGFSANIISCETSRVNISLPYVKGVYTPIPVPVVIHLRSSSLMENVIANLLDIITVVKYLSTIMDELKSNFVILHILNFSKFIPLLLLHKDKYVKTLHVYNFVSLRSTPVSILKHYDLIVVSSQRLLEKLKHSIVVIDDKSVIKLHIPVNDNFFKVRKDCDITHNANELRLLYIGNINEKRFPKEFLYALAYGAEKNDVRISLKIFAPPTSYNAKYYTELMKLIKRATINNKKLSIELKMKRLSIREKIQLLKITHFFIYPSVSYDVAIDPPLTILESLASGTPVASVLAFEVLKNMLNSVVSPNYYEMLERMLKIIHGKRYRDMCLNAKLHVMNHHPLIATKKFIIDVLRALMKR